MNSKNQVTMAMAFFLSSPLIAQTKPSFFETVGSIKNLYKISAEELYTILDVSFEPAPLITADQLTKILSTPSNTLVINVLPERYHNDCHIKGSINVPLPKLVECADSWDRSQKIVTYCALESCDAGEKGCILLKCMGFTNVQDYKGGIKEWFQLNCPTEGPAESDYLHTKGLPADECTLYPETIVCSTQTRWITKYKEQE